MAGSSNVRAGGAFVEILTKDNALRKGLDNAAKTLQKWGDGINALGKTFLKIGTAAIAPLVATSKVFAEMGDALAKASTRTGVTVEKLSELKYAAEQSGTDFESLEGGLRKMSKTIVEAAKGSDTATESLRLLGLDVSNLFGMKPDEQFRTIAQAMSHVADPTLKAALAMEIFGKGGTALLPMMDQGAAGLDELGRQAKALGLVWSTQDAKAAEEFGDRLDDLWKVVKKLTSDVGAALMPILREVAVSITSNVVAASKWIQAHREVIQLALKVAAGTVAAGAGFLVLGTAVRSIGTVIGGVSAALGVFGSVIGTVAQLLSTVLFSGIGLTVAALGGLAAYFIYTSDTGQKALSALGSYFGSLKDTALAAFQGIKDALAAGDWALAGQVAIAGLKTAWLQGIAPIREAWEGVKIAFLNSLSDFSVGALAAWEIISSAFLEAWTRSIGAARYAWAKFIEWVSNLWDGVTHTVSDVFLKLMNKVGALTDKQLEEALALNAQQSNANAAETAAKARAETQAAIDQYKSADTIPKERDKRLADLATAGQQMKAADKAASDAKIAEAKKQEADAKAALAAATGQAKTAAANAPPPPTFAKPPVFDPNAAASGLNDVLRKVSAGGTFNAAAIFGLGGQNIQQQQLETQKKIEQNTRGGGRSGTLQFN